MEMRPNFKVMPNRKPPTLNLKPISMTAAILTILAALVPFIVWLIKRQVTTNDDPKTQNEKRYEQTDADIGKGDGVQAGLHGADDLDALDRLQNGKGDQR